MGLLKKESSDNLKDKYIEDAEKVIRDQEEQYVAVQTVANMTADYYQTLISKGVSEMSAVLLTSAWLSLTFNSNKQ